MTAACGNVPPPLTLSAVSLHLTMALSDALTPRRLEDLHPDAKNPRLPDDLRDWPEDDPLLVYIADTFDALNVAESIARYGFWSSEPLIVTEEDGRLVVLEGNRRLTALLGLAREDLRSQFASPNPWHRHAEHAGVTLGMEIPVLLADERRDADALIGFRHIAGIQAWSPLQRARFIAHLVEERDQPFAEVAETVGEDEPIVRLHYRNQDVLRLLRRAGREELAKQGEQRFGTFTAAMNRVALRDYIGVPSAADVTEGGEHFDRAYLAKAEDLFSWMYGTEADKKVIRETRDLGRLAEVIRNQEALDELQRTRDLDAAYALTAGAEKTVYRQFAMAMGNLRAVANRAELLAGDQRALDLVVELEDLAAGLRASLESGGGTD